MNFISEWMIAAQLRYLRKGLQRKSFLAIAPSP
jgi:hypothetical protein